MSFADSIEDLFGSKIGSMDIHYKCISDHDNSWIEEYGIKKIGNNKFIFSYHPEEKIYEWPVSSVIEYKRKAKGQNFYIYIHISY